MSVQYANPDGVWTDLPPGLRQVMRPGYTVRNNTPITAHFRLVQHGAMLSGMELEPGDQHHFTDTYALVLSND